MVRLSSRVPVLILRRYRRPITPTPPKRHWFGLFRVRSPLLAESQLFSLPTGTKMFQFPAFAFPLRGILGLQPSELPHSEMLGSKVVCTYPSLIAAYHVLHRLPEPRHPPFALSFFFYSLAAPRSHQMSLGDIKATWADRSPHHKTAKAFLRRGPRFARPPIKGKTFACEIVSISQNWLIPQHIYIVNLIFRFAREVILLSCKAN